MLCLASAESALAQDQAGCGTIGSERAYRNMQRMIETGELVLPPLNRGRLPKICIPITCHIVRTSTGGGGIPEDRVDLAIEDLNIHMDAVSMEFFRKGDFVFLDDSSFYSGINTLAEVNSLRQQNPVEGTLNVWFVEELATEFGDLAGISSFPNEGVQGIVMRNENTASPIDRSTFSHEVGHYFNLFHTFRGSAAEPFGEAECVDGSNSATAGDLITDTNADFGRFCDTGQRAVNGACQLTCSDIDPCGSGDLYDPPIRNLMSYSTFRCTNQFSNEQLQRMRAIAQGVRSDPEVDGYIDYPDCLFTEAGACCVIGQDICFRVGNSGICDNAFADTVYMGPGTDCASLLWGTCNVPNDGQGACCVAEGCLLVSGFAECVSLSGSYFGNNTNCSEAPCEAIPGACCLIDECFVVGEEFCNLTGGVFLGSNTVCSFLACRDETPYVPVIPQNLFGDFSPQGTFAGNAIAMSGSNILFSAMGQEIGGLPNAGLAYSYSIEAVEGSGFQIVLTPLQPPTRQAGEFFGSSIAVDSTDTLAYGIVGAYRYDYLTAPPRFDAGKAYIFNSAQWNQTKYILENPQAYRSSYDYFGYDVDIGFDGGIGGLSAIVGSPRSNVNGSDSGAAFWFVKDSFEDEMVPVIIDTGALFDEPSRPLDYLGESVAMCVSGGFTYGAIGAPGRDTQDFFNAGELYVLSKGPSPSTTPRFKTSLISNPSPSLFKHFGRSVDLYDDNGTPYLIVGALLRQNQDPSDTGNQGSGVAFVYEYSVANRTWIRMSPMLVPFVGTEPLYNNCAESVSLTRNNGKLMALIGCPSANVGTMVSPGLAFLYNYNGAVWEYQKEIIASDREAGDSFGYAVALGEDFYGMGIGAPNADGGKLYLGTIPAFRSSNSASDSRTWEMPLDAADLGSETEGIGHADGIIGSSDIRALIDVWGSCDHDCLYFGCHGDLNGDCRVDAADLLIVISRWGN